MNKYPRFIKPKVDCNPTRFLYVSGIDFKLVNHTELIKETFSKFGDLDDHFEGGAIDMIPDKVKSYFRLHSHLCYNFVVFLAVFLRSV